MADNLDTIVINIQIILVNNFVALNLFGRYCCEPYTCARLNENEIRLIERRNKWKWKINDLPFGIGSWSIDDLESIAFIERQFLVVVRIEWV